MATTTFEPGGWLTSFILLSQEVFVDGLLCTAPTPQSESRMFVSIPHTTLYSHLPRHPVTQRLGQPCTDLPFDVICLAFFRSRVPHYTHFVLLSLLCSPEMNTAYVHVSWNSIRQCVFFLLVEIRNIYRIYENNLQRRTWCRVRFENLFVLP